MSPRKLRGRAVGQGGSVQEVTDSREAPIIRDDDPSVLPGEATSALCP